MKMLDLMSQKYANVVFKTMPGSRSSYCSYCCHVGVDVCVCSQSLSSAFPVPFALSRGPAGKNVFLVSFVEAKR